MTNGEGANTAIIALLDSGPLGLVTHPGANSVLVPEITYYEIRRELRRTELKSGLPSQGLAHLEAFAADAGKVPITSDVILLATEFWAEARHQHFQGAPDVALDGDMILCAQARLLTPERWGLAGAEVVIVTKNVKHLTHFATALHWRDIGKPVSA